MVAEWLSARQQNRNNNNNDREDNNNVNFCGKLHFGFVWAAICLEKSPASPFAQTKAASCQLRFQFGGHSFEQAPGLREAACGKGAPNGRATAKKGIVVIETG